MPEETIADEGKYRSRRHFIPSADLKYISPYEWEGPELQWLQQNTVDKIFTAVFDLSVAKPFGQPQIVTVPGRAISLFGINTSSSGAYDPVANTGIETVQTTAFVFCRLDSTRLDEGFPLKHNRGFRGPFSSLYLSWPAQANVSARIVIYKCGWVPWQNGEAAT